LDDINEQEIHQEMR